MAQSAPTPRPGILDIAAYVGGEAHAPGGGRQIRLASNEGALGPSPRAVDAYAAVAAEIHRYPDGGSTRLREALARHHGLDPSRIVVGAGSDEIIALIVRAYAGPGDEVVYSRHGFLMYPIAAKSVGAVPVTAPETDLTADVDALLAAVTPRTRIVFLANPNNPTGTMLPVDEVRRLHAGLPSDVVLVIDAAYAEYVSQNDYSAGTEIVDAGDNTVMLRTFSKMFALGGMRLGWGYFPPGIADVLNRVRGPFNVGASAMAAGVAALEDTAFQDRVRAHNDVWLPWFAGECKKLGLEPLPSVGNFVLVKFPAARSAAAANDFLMARAIIPRSVANYGLPEFLRFTIGTEAEMRAVVSALADFMK